MRLTIKQLNSLGGNICPKRPLKQNWKIIRKAKHNESPGAVEVAEKTDCHSVVETNSRNTASCDYRENEMKIQMLSKPLFEQVFKNTSQNTSNEVTVNRLVLAF